MQPVFIYFTAVYSLVAFAVLFFHFRTVGSMTLSTLSPLPIPAGLTRMTRRRIR